MRKERKNEALLWFGKWTSKLGNIVFDYANSVSIVGAFAHAPWVLALYQSSETVIQIVFNLIGGAKADSGSRKKILIVTDVLSAAICLAVSFFVALPRMAEVVIAANALLAVVYAFNSPTYRSIVREMVDGERIGMYNSVSNGGGEVIKIAGPMVGMLLVRWIGVRGALLFDALTFLLSAVSEMLLTPISGVQKKPKEKKNIFRDIAEGFSYLVRERQLLFLILLSALVNFFLAGFNLLCPYTDVMYASFGIEFYSKVLVMEAAGGLLGSLISSRLGSRVKENARLMVLFLGAMGAACGAHRERSRVPYSVPSLRHGADGFQHSVHVICPAARRRGVSWARVQHHFHRGSAVYAGGLVRFLLPARYVKSCGVCRGRRRDPFTCRRREPHLPGRHAKNRITKPADRM